MGRTQCQAEHKGSARPSGVPSARSARCRMDTGYGVGRKCPREGVVGTVHRMARPGPAHRYLGVTQELSSLALPHGAQDSLPDGQLELLANDELHGLVMGAAVIQQTVLALPLAQQCAVVEGSLRGVASVLSTVLKKSLLQGHSQGVLVPMGGLGCQGEGDSCPSTKATPSAGAARGSAEHSPDPGGEKRRESRQARPGANQRAAPAATVRGRGSMQINPAS